MWPLNHTRVQCSHIRLAMWCQIFLILSLRENLSVFPQKYSHMKMSAVTQSSGSGMPTAVCCPCICCSASATCSSVQQSCRNTTARLRNRGLSEMEKRSMHCKMPASVMSERDSGVVRFMSVVMADRTVSSLRLERQFVTRLIPPLCRIVSRHSGSILRLHSPPNSKSQTTGD